MTDIVDRLLHMIPMDILGGKPMLLNPDGPAAVHEIDELRNEIINFRTEIERLRKALEDIASGQYSGKMLMSLPPQDPAVNRARAALEGK